MADARTDTDKTTIIDPQADMEGKLTGKDALVLGKFRGEIELSGRLQIGEGARVEARIRADAAEIAGQCKGEIAVRSLILLEKARVEGTLEAQTLGIREGAQVTGPVNVGGTARAGGTAAPRPGPAVAQG